MIELEAFIVRILIRFPLFVVLKESTSGVAAVFSFQQLTWSSTILEIPLGRANGSSVRITLIALGT
jgi:hypothetical protein